MASTSTFRLREAARVPLFPPDDAQTYLDMSYPSASAIAGKGVHGRTLDDDIAYWDTQVAEADAELAASSKLLPSLLEETQAEIQRFLEDAQSLSLQRYALSDKLSSLLQELSSDAADRGNDEAGVERRRTVLEEMEELQRGIDQLQAGLAWVTMLENVLVLSEKVLDPAAHRPSPLAAVPHFRALDDAVYDMEATLPGGMAILDVVRDTRRATWDALKGVMADNLVKASEALRWPRKVDYPSVPPPQRRAFERAFVDLLYLQNEGEHLGIEEPGTTSWTDGRGLYPLQALVRPIELRFKYHFQGTRGTNRLDKPEWAFANLLDMLYEHRDFFEDYIKPLSARAGYDVDVQSELTLLLFPLALNLLRSRIPHLLPHPALLAHTVYQTIVFDDALRSRGFDLGATSLYKGETSEIGEWEGLAGIVLREEGWFNKWLQGERKFADGQLNGILSSSEAWAISDDTNEKEPVRATSSARQIKALVEQITDRYAPLPAATYKLPFVSTQLGLLDAYRARIAASLDAFETLSSAFVRAVPGALAGNTRGGIQADQARLTGGVHGLQRLVKAWFSAAYVRAALVGWADELLFVELSDELATTPYLSSAYRLPSVAPGQSVFDAAVAAYGALAARAEDMVVRHLSAAVEGDLKPYLTRRWDAAAPAAADAADELADDAETRALGEHAPALLAAADTWAALLAALDAIPPAPALRIYRRAATQIAHHVAQRAVFAGWSKYTAHGGDELHAAVRRLVASSGSGLRAVLDAHGHGHGHDAVDVNVNVIERPWRELQAAAALLRLPSEAGKAGSAAPMDARDAKNAKDAKDEPTFSQAMAAAWTGGAPLDRFAARVGVEMGADAMQAVLRRRVECWR
ncbi:hypothetical protein Q5752_001517 [Cryptotrichosporon argae]